MTNNNTAGSRVSRRVRIAILLTVLGFISCGGKGGSKTDPIATPSTTYTITASCDNNGSIAPTGVTTVTQGASQSYTITPNIGFAIATLMVDGNTAPTSLVYTFSNVQANHTISATFAPALPGSIALSIVPSRTSGVAPLAVFFDASDTTDASITSRPFHDLEYTWNFGDPVVGTAGAWANGAQPGVSSKNSATGPVAAHVFETPGTYTVSVSAFDGTNTATTTMTITVADPDMLFAGANTVCVGATVIPIAGAGGCPAGAATAAQSSFPSIISTYALTGKRVLLKRGDTFTAGTTARLLETGPGIVGSFGTGALPVIQNTSPTIANGNAMLAFSNPSTPDFADWRVMDLEFDGMGIIGVAGMGIDAYGGGIKQVLALRNTTRNLSTSYGFAINVLNVYNNNPTPDAHSLNIDQLFVVEANAVPGLNTQYSGYNSGNRVAFMGNSFDNGGNQDLYDENGVLNCTNCGSHILRFMYLGKAVISNNTFTHPGFDRLHIKLHAPTWINGAPGQAAVTTFQAHYFTPGQAYTIASVGTTDFTLIGAANNNVGTSFTATGIGAGTGTATHNAGAVDYSSYSSAAITGDGETKYVIIADNKFNEWLGPWVLGISPQDGAREEHVRDVIVERNIQNATATSQSSYHICAREVTVRNNLLLGSTSNIQTLVDIGLYGGEPPATNVRVYNNSMYTAYAVPNGQTRMVRVSNAVVSNVIARNNLLYAPNANNPHSFVDAGGTNIVQSNNSDDTQVKTLNPFTTAPPSLLADWKLGAGSYAINNGTPVPVWSDFFRTLRPQNGVIDMGAVEVP